VGCLILYVYLQYTVFVDAGLGGILAGAIIVAVAMHLCNQVHLGILRHILNRIGACAPDTPVSLCLSDADGTQAICSSRSSTRSCWCPLRF
jgi:hypothetical protein